MPHDNLAAISRLLDTEGYDGYLHNKIKTYWVRNVMDAEREASIVGVERKFSELVASLELSEKEKDVLGKFISLRSKQSFDAGLRIGIQALCFDAITRVRRTKEPTS